MPKFRIRITISIEGEKKGSYASSIYVGERSIYNHFKERYALKELWFRETSPSGNSPSGALEVLESSDSERLRSIEEDIEKLTGMKRSKKGILTDEEELKYYSPGIRVTYSSQELAAAEYLDFSPPASKEIGRFGLLLDDETYVVELDKRQQNKHLFGCLFPFFEICGFAEPLKGQLAECGLRHLVFDPILLVEPKVIRERGMNSPEPLPSVEPAPPAKILKPLWKLTSDVVLPPCLYALLHNGGQPFTGDLARGCAYDNSTGLGLRFKREAIESLPPFDVAVTRERTGIARSNAFRQVIVSQKFRQAMLELGVKSAEYVPVILE
jgi:hypothetical protein